MLMPDIQTKMKFNKTSTAECRFPQAWLLKDEKLA